jgi:hypothetical protein
MVMQSPKITIRLSFQCRYPEIIPMPKVKFPLGRLVATPAALAALTESGQSPTDFLSRHIQGDWGMVCPEDWQLNDDALVSGERLFSAYKTLKAVKIWIITEHDRSSTCVLLPEDY